MSRANRRNYYRVLHVQPDAHPAVIRTAYRTLMQTLRLHPDLGGDGAAASLITEAYAVLSDPVRRAQYDAQLDLRRARAASGPPTDDTGSDGPPRAKALRAPAPWPANGHIAACPFCAAALPAPGHRPPRCAGCASPLTPPPSAGHITASRRAFERQHVHTTAEYFLRGDAAPRPATLRDFSPHGAQLTAAEATPLGQTLALKTQLFDALARVVECQPAPPASGQWLLRLEFLTLALTAPTGSLVSTQV
jgi:curved DNA-binding protein CbpA